MGYKHNIDENTLIDDLIGMSINARQTIQEFHHLHLELTCYSEEFPGTLIPGHEKDDCAKPIYLPQMVGFVIVEDAAGQPLANPVNFKYNHEIVEGFFDYMGNLLMAPNVRMIYQVLPRLIVVLDPIDGFPFRAEISNHELSLEHLVGCLDTRDRLNYWLFQDRKLGRRLTVYLTPNKKMHPTAGTDLPSPEPQEKPVSSFNEMRDKLRDLGMKMQAETAAEMGANLPTPNREVTPHTQSPTENLEKDRFRKLMEEAERSVQDAVGAEIPTVPLHAGEGETTETEQELLDIKRRNSLPNNREEIESKLKQMLDQELNNPGAISGLPPQAAFTATSTEEKKSEEAAQEAVEWDTIAAPQNEEMPAKEASETVNALFGNVEDDDSK